MKVFIRYYQSPFIGNCSTDAIHIESNEITVAQLKEIIFEKYRIVPAQQRLTTKVVESFLVMMTNEWPLSFFNIHEGSKIYLEFIQVVDKVFIFFLKQT